MSWPATQLDTLACLHVENIYDIANVKARVVSETVQQPGTSIKFGSCSLASPREVSVFKSQASLHSTVLPYIAICPHSHFKSTFLPTKSILHGHNFSSLSGRVPATGLDIS